MSIMEKTAWELIGWDDGAIRIKGGRATYEAVMYDDSKQGSCVKLCKLIPRGKGLFEVKRYVKPETIIEVLEDLRDKPSVFA